MNLDQAIGKLYTAVNECREKPMYQEALQALNVFEDAAEALQKSQKVLCIKFQGDYMQELHSCMLLDAITKNKRLLDP